MNWSVLWEKIQAHAVSLVFAFLALVVPSALLIAQEQLANYAEGHPIAMVRVLAGLVLITTVFAAMFFYYRPRLCFDKRLGIYRDRKTGLYYCSSCLITSKVKAPLRERADGWRCQVVSCGKSYANPDYKQPPSPPPPQRRSNWMSGGPGT